MGTMGFLYSQFFGTPSVPKTSFKDQVVIVTGSNIGLGLETARRVVSLDAAKVILAVRNQEKGIAAQKDIEATTKRSGVVEVWPLDLSSYASTIAFGTRAASLSRLDAVVENAGIATSEFQIFEEDESTITVNVVNTFLLALLVLPKLRATAAQTGVASRLVIVSSEVHFWAAFKERQSAAKGGLFKALADPKIANMDDRYNTSKLLDVLCTRELVARIQEKHGQQEMLVTIDTVNPGFCHSELTREFSGIKGFVVGAMKLFLARTTEVGSRTFVLAADTDMVKEKHGSYLSDGKVVPPSKFVRSEEGAETQRAIWDELMVKLEKIHPGISHNI